MVKEEKPTLRVGNEVIAFESLVSAVQHHVTTHPERNVLSFLADGDSESGSLNYQQLDVRARTIAAQLTDSPFINTDEKPCALLAFSNGVEFITSFFACLYAGIIAVPVYPPQHRPSYLERLNLIAGDSQAQFILGMDAYLSKVGEKYDDYPALSALTRIAVDVLPTQDAAQFHAQPDAIRHDDIAFLQYTSGSTSNPKGVMVTHQNLLHNIMSMQQRFEHTEASVIVSWLPMFHDMGLIGAVLQAVCIGAHCVAMTPAAFLQKPMRWLNAIHHYRGTSSYAPNFAYDLCAARATPEDIERLDLSCWKIALNGSEPIRPDTLDNFFTTFKKAGFAESALYPAYGLAEGTLFVSGSPLGSGAVFTHADAHAYEQQRKVIAVEANSNNARRLVSSGQPSDLHLVLIVDPDTQEVCADGEIGEVWMCSQSSALGYWKNPEKTAETFHATVKGALASEYQGKRFMRTGDYGFLQQGELYISGRIKEVIIIRGANYYPQAIEESVQKAVDGLKDNGGAAFTVNNNGQEQLVVVQEVERTAIKKLDKADAFATAKRVISEDFGLQLADMIIIRPATLPKTSSGKIQRTKAQLYYQEGSLAEFARMADFAQMAPVSKASATPEPIPLTTEEEALCTMLRMVLATQAQIDMDVIVPTQDVMSLGLDSLAVIAVAQNIQMMTGVELPLVELLSSPTVLDIAQMIIQVRNGNHISDVIAANNAKEALTPPPGDTPKKSKATVAALSVNQQQLWLLQDKAPQAVAYNVPICLVGRFPIANVESAWRQLVAAHPVLNADIAVHDGELMQRFDTPLDASSSVASVIDIQSAPASIDTIRAASQRAFDLHKNERVRVQYWQGETQDVVLINIHHITVDMLSMLTVVEQFLGLVTGKITEIPTARVDYRDFVVWQQQHLTTQSQTYWQTQLASAPPVLQWPLRQPRPNHQTFAGSSVDFTLNHAQSQALKHLAREQKTTINTVLLSVYQTFLAKLCYQRQFAIGVLNAGRPNAEYNAVVGYFVQPAPFMVDLPVKQEKQALIQQTHTQMLAVIRHQHSATAALLNHHNTDTPAGVPPVFQTLFSYYPRMPLGATPFLGAQATSQIAAFPDYHIQHLPSPGAQLDLSLLVADAGEQLALRFEYNGALFTADQVQQFAASFTQVASDFANSAVTHLGEMRLLPRMAKATHHTLSIPSDSNICTPPEHTVIAQIWAQFTAQPQQIAVQVGENSLTYDALKHKVQGIAQQLSSQIKQGDVVAICCERSEAMICSILAVMSLGAAYSPLDAQQPIERLQYCIETAQTQVIITHGPCLARVQAIHAKTPLSLINIDDIPTNTAVDFAPVNVPMDAAAYVIFTSGSTGLPKGVVNSHLGLSNRLGWMAAAYDVSTDARILQKTPYTFDVSVWELLLPLMQGGTLVFAKPEGHKDADYLLSLIEQQRINRLHFVPAMLEVFIDELAANNHIAALATVQQIFCSGEALSKHLHDRVNRLLPQVELHNLYGPTEAAIDVTSWHCQASDEFLSVPIGKAMDNIALYALDHDGMPVPAGVMGELFISGYGVATGYINRDDLTAERFVRNPFFEPQALQHPFDSAYQRMYQTGDLVRYHHNGIIEYLGRTDSQVKVRGFRVELAEIDARLIALNTVKEAVTIVSGSAASARLISYVVLHSTEMATAATAIVDVDETALRAQLAEYLPSYMLPDRFIGLTHMPVTANGKLDRRALPSVSESAAQLATQDTVTPLVTETEKQIAVIFAKWLNIDVAVLGQESHFFTLGGHSLLAAKVIQQLNAEFALSLRLKDLFDAPTIAKLAQQLSQQLTQQPATHQPAQTSLLQVTKSEQPLQQLSASQARLWFHYQREGASGVYNIPCVLHLEKPLDKAVLQQRVDALLAQHPLLQSVYTTAAHTRNDNDYGQMQHRTDLCCEVVQQVVSNSAALAVALTTACETPFALDAELPIRVRLITCADAQHAQHFLVVCLHHIVADGQTLAPVLQALSDHATPTTAANATSALGYQDFVAWQQAWLTSSAAQQELAYWQRNLADLAPLLALPYDFPRPAKQSTAGDAIRFDLPIAMSQQLHRVAAANDVSLFMLLLAAFNMLLARVSQQMDIAVGTPILGRPDPALDDTLGYFANTLVIRQNFAELLAEVGEPPTVAQVLAQTKRQVMAASEHQWLPFDQLVEQLQPERSLSYAPLFQVMFSVTHQASFASLFTDNPASLYHREHQLAKFDVSLMLETQGDSPSEQRIGGYLEFATALFTRQTMQQWLDAYQVLLQSLCDITAQQQTAQTQWQALPLLNAEQQQRVIERGKGKTVDYARANIVQRFAESVAKQPNSIAITDPQNSLTYHALQQQAIAFALQLQHAGVHSEQPVLLVTDSNNARVVALLAIVLVGAYYVPLDANNPAERNQFIAEKTQAQCVVVDTQLLLPAGLTSSELSTLTLDTQALDVTHSARMSDFAGWQASVSAPFYLMFTSGSTGEPKGTLIPQRGVLRLVTDAQFMSLDADSVFLHAAPLAFDASTLEIWGPLLNAGRIVVSNERVPTPAGLQQLIQQHAVTCAWLTSSLFNHLIDQDSHCVAGLSQLLVGGDVVSSQHVALAYRDNPTLQIINGYGPTETTTFAVCYPIPRAAHAGNPTHSANDDIAIGYPIQATQLYIVSENAGELQLLPDGAVGELVIGGAGLAQAYLGREQLTAEKFIPDPFARLATSTEAQAKVYRTGDLVRRDNAGRIHYLGRDDQQVKIRGFRIELSEINQALLRFADIEKAATVVEGDKHNKRLVAFVVLNTSDDTPDKVTARLRQRQKQLAQQLPSYMVPSALQTLQDLPLTVNGKLDQNALPSIDWQAWQQAEYIAPETRVEQQIAACWAEYFSLETTAISRHANFFDLGGHSLLAAKFSQWAEATLGKTLAVNQLFTSPELADVAALLESADASVLADIPQADEATLSFAQQRLLFIEQANDPSAVYNIPLFLYWEDGVDVSRLGTALQQLVARHQVLRTRFVTTDTGNQLIIHPVDTWQLHTTRAPIACTNTAFTPSLTDDAWHAFFSDFAHQPFDVFAQIPFRAQWLPLSPVEAGNNILMRGVLMMNFHHIAFDGWSQDVILSQLQQAYLALGEQHAPQSHDDTGELLQYQDYAAWQHTHSHSATQQQQLAYWQQQLQGVPPLLDLPTDLPRPAAQRFDGDCLAVHLSPQLSQQIQAFSQANGVTPYMTLLAGFWLLLAKQSGEDDIAVGSPVANREHPQTADLVGFFANTIVLRGLLDNQLSVAELLAYTKATVLAAQANQNAPFEQVVEALNPPRSTAYSPIFQVMFSLLHTDEQQAQFAQQLHVPHKVAKFDVSFMLTQSEQGITGYIEYSTALFHESTMQDYWQRFQWLLTQMMQQPTVALASLSLAPQAPLLAEQLALQPERLTFVDETVFIALSKQVMQHADHVAVIDAETALTYSQLWERVSHFAAYLQQHGVMEGSAVAVYLPRSVDLLVSLLAIQMAGGFYVPLDPKYPAQRSENILTSAKPALVISDATLTRSIRELCDCEVLTLTSACFTASGLTYREPTRAPAELAAYAIYTSGSTGLPKGIAIHHRNVMAMLRWAEAEFSPEQRQHILAATSICFDLSVFELFLPLITGQTVTIVDNALSLIELPSHTINRYQSQGVAPLSLINTVPSAMDALVAAEAIPASVTTINLAGEPLSRALVDRLYAIPTVQCVYNLYGPSEDTTYSTVYRVPKDASSANWHEKPLIGQPIRNSRAYILDAGGNLVPDGVAGELYLAGEGVAHGYLGRADLTERVFLADRFTNDGSRMYRTGDKVRRLRNGELDYLGRLDFQVKLRGFRIELGELESVAGQVSAVREAVAVVNTSQGDNLVLFLLLADNTPAPNAICEQVQQKLSATLPDYMQPTALDVVDAFPTLPNGKIDRASLKTVAVTGLQSNAYEAPETPTEQWLADTWQQLLRHERIGRNDNFFALGGHSLLATQLVTRIRQHYQLEIPIKTIFQQPELRRQAAMLDLQIASQLLVNGTDDNADDADFEEGTI